MAASKITFEVTHVDRTGDWTITTAYVGDMVDPDTGTGSAWYSPPKKPQWTWENLGSNVKRFGLNFKFLKPDGGELIAIEHIVVDPGSLDAGDYTVEVYLEACCVEGAPTNPQLKTTVKSGPATVMKTQGQPDCPTC